MMCLFLDAFRPDYVRHTSYIKSLTKGSAYGELETVLGYTGIIASFLTGLYPDKHGVFTLFKKLDRPRNSFNNKLWVNLKRYARGERFFYTPLRIPQEKARYFGTALRKAWPQKGCLDRPTIFDVMEKSGVSFTMIDWPNIFRNRKGSMFRQNTIGSVVKKARASRSGFTMAHFLLLEDAHKTGVNGIKDKVRELDEAIECLDQDNMVMFSDHGMSDIRGYFDLEGALSGLGLKFGRDYVYFMGSTMARFWFSSSSAERRVRDMLGSLRCGKMIRESDFRVPRTCDALFLANLGIVFHPNFFMGGTKYKAMHGWDPREKEQKAFYLVKGAGHKKADARMVDMAPTILKLMGLPGLSTDGKPVI